MKKIIAVLVIAVLAFSAVGAMADVNFRFKEYKVTAMQENDIITLLAFDEGTPIEMIVITFDETDNIYFDIPYYNDVILTVEEVDTLAIQIVDYIFPETV